MTEPKEDIATITIVFTRATLKEHLTEEQYKTLTGADMNRIAGMFASDVQTYVEELDYALYFDELQATKEASS